LQRRVIEQPEIVGRQETFLLFDQTLPVVGRRARPEQGTRKLEAGRQGAERQNRNQGGKAHGTTDFTPRRIELGQRQQHQNQQARCRYPEQPVIRRSNADQRQEQQYADRDEQSLTCIRRARTEQQGEQPELESDELNIAGDQVQADDCSVGWNPAGNGICGSNRSADSRAAE